MDTKAPFSAEFLAKYELLNILGEGAFGVVVRARNRYLDKEVAIKTLKELREDDVARFNREAKVLSSLNHKNILQVFDGGIDNNVPYIVMELIEGRTVDTYLNETAWSLKRCLEVVAEVGDALVFAHEKGLVHRDVKPANAFVLSDGSVKLGDFGLARLVAHGTTLTKTGVMMGTPHYLAPEIVNWGKASPASDQYALAVMCYQMVTGRMPFEGSNLLDILTSRLTNAPPPPSATRNGLPIELDSILLKALSIEPDNRFTGIEDFSKAIRNISTNTDSKKVVVKKSGITEKKMPNIATTTRVNRKILADPFFNAGTESLVIPPKKKNIFLFFIVGLVGLFFIIMYVFNTQSELSQNRGHEQPPPSMLVKRTAGGNKHLFREWKKIENFLPKLEILKISESSDELISQIAKSVSFRFGVSPDKWAYWIQFGKWLESGTDISQIPYRTQISVPFENKVIYGKSTLDGSSGALAFLSVSNDDGRLWLICGRLLELDGDDKESRIAYRIGIQRMSKPDLLVASPLFWAGLARSLVLTPGYSLTKNEWQKWHPITGDAMIGLRDAIGESQPDLYSQISDNK